MSDYKFFEDIITRLEQMQQALDNLRETVKQKIKGCMSQEPPK